MLVIIHLGWRLYFQKALTLLYRHYKLNCWHWKLVISLSLSLFLSLHFPYTYMGFFVKVVPVHLEVLDDSMAQFCVILIVENGKVLKKNSCVYVCV